MPIEPIPADSPARAIGKRAAVIADRYAPVILFALGVLLGAVLVLLAR